MPFVRTATVSSFRAGSRLLLLRQSALAKRLPVRFYDIVANDMGVKHTVAIAQTNRGGRQIRIGRNYRPSGCSTKHRELVERHDVDLHTANVFRPTLGASAEALAGE